MEEEDGGEEAAAVNFLASGTLSDVSMRMWSIATGRKPDELVALVAISAVEEGIKTFNQLHDALSGSSGQSTAKALTKVLREICGDDDPHAADFIVALLEGEAKMFAMAVEIEELKGEADQESGRKTKKRKVLAVLSPAHAPKKNVKAAEGVKEPIFQTIEEYAAFANSRTAAKGLTDENIKVYLDQRLCACGEDVALKRWGARNGRLCNPCRNLQSKKPK